MGISIDIKKKNLIVNFICYLYVLLFVYASVSKVLDYENFRVQIGQSPLLSAYAGAIAPFVIISELLISFLLLFKKLRLAGLYLATGLMVAFTVYIFLILNYSEFVPCSCGGVLEDLGWTEHLIFNIVFVFLGLIGIWSIESESGRKYQINFLRCIASIVPTTIGVLVLYFTSEYLMKKENPFIRRFIPHAIKIVKAKDLGYNSYYFAGYSEGEIYLGNYTTPLILTIVDTAFTKERSFKINLDGTNYQYQSIQVRVKESYFYVYDGTVPIIYRGNLNSSKAYTLSLGDAYFTQMEIADSVHFLLNTKSNKTKSRVLAYLKVEPKPIVHINQDLLQGHLDGIFDTDGRLIGDEAGEDFVYVYYYRNELPVFNKKLNLKGKFRTIDTISRAQVKVKKLSNGITKMEAPPLKVNDKSVLYRDVLFNQSNLMGKFESSDLWKLATVIDMYNVDQKEYLGSFFIQDRGKEKMTQILVADNRLFVLSGNEIIQYQFAQSVQNYFKKGEAENP